MERASNTSTISEYGGLNEKQIMAIEKIRESIKDYF